MGLAARLDAEMLGWGEWNLEDPPEWVDLVQCERLIVQNDKILA